MLATKKYLLKLVFYSYVTYSSRFTRLLASRTRINDVYGQLFAILGLDLWINQWHKGDLRFILITWMPKGIKGKMEGILAFEFLWNCCWISLVLEHMQAYSSSQNVMESGRWFNFNF